MFLENVIFTKPIRDAFSGAVIVKASAITNDIVTHQPILVGFQFSISNLVTNIISKVDSLNLNSASDCYTVFFHQNNNTV